MGGQILLILHSRFVPSPVSIGQVHYLMLPALLTIGINSHIPIPSAAIPSEKVFTPSIA